MRVRRNHEPDEEKGPKDHISDSVFTITLGAVIIALAAMLIFGPN